MPINNIIILEKEGVKEVWGALTDICVAHKDILYHSIKDKNYPFEYKGYSFFKIAYKTKIIGLIK